MKTHQNCLLDFRWPLRIPRDVIWTNKHTIYIPICNEQPPTTLFEKIFFGFFYDILIYSVDYATHLHRLHLVLLLNLHSYYAKLTECFFAVSIVEYLGHIISDQGVKPDPSKVQAIQEWPQP